MGWLWGSDDTRAVGNASVQVTSGLRQLFTGDIPPEIVAEMNKLDEDHVTRRWEADAKVRWWESSRSIVLLWLNFNIIALIWIDGATTFELNSAIMTTMLGVLGVVNTAFFGSKGLEYIKAGKAP